MAACISNDCDVGHAMGDGSAFTATWGARWEMGQHSLRRGAHRTFGSLFTATWDATDVWTSFLGDVGLGQHASYQVQ